MRKEIVVANLIALVIITIASTLMTAVVYVQSFSDLPYAEMIYRTVMTFIAAFLIQVLLSAFTQIAGYALKSFMESREVKNLIRNYRVQKADRHFMVHSGKSFRVNLEGKWHADVILTKDDFLSNDGRIKVDISKNLQLGYTAENCDLDVYFYNNTKETIWVNIWFLDGEAFLRFETTEKPLAMFVKKALA